MFKAQILRRSFSLFNRRRLDSRVIRSAARDGHQTIQVQRVRFRKPFLTTSRCAAIGLTIGTIYTFLTWLEETPEEEAERKREEEQLRQRRATKDAARANGVQVVDDDDEEEDDEPEAILFLPTGLSRAKPQQYYKGSDPEWQEFVRIAPDRERIDRIRGELVGTIRTIAMKSPQYVLRLGKINPAAGTSWIEFMFPDGPPTEFERPGIEITDELTIRKSTRPMNDVSHHRLSTILFPTAVANSLYADSKKKLVRTWVDFKVYTGWEEPKKRTQLQQMIASLPPNHPPFSPQPTPSTPPSSASPTPPATGGGLQPSPSGKQPTPSTGEDPAYYDRFGLSLPKPTALTLDLSTFRHTFDSEHRKNVMKMQPPRGTFMVSGLVEIIGERARMTLDVIAAYDPKKGKFVKLQARLRTLTPYRQDPRGGP